MNTKILVVFLLVVFSTNAYSQEPETDDKLDTLLERLTGNDDFGDIKSQKLLEDIKNDLKNGRMPEPEPAVLPSGAKEPSPRIPIKRFQTKVRMSETQVKDLRDTISRYLDWYKDQFKTPGVELLEPKHLDPSLLRLRPFSNGKDVRLQVVFGEEFHKHVAIRGRRHLLKQRLRITAFLAAAIATALVLLYGTLKVLSARSKRDDYLSASQVPMV